MPDIQFCTRCGKQVLIAHYPWSKKEIICKVCEDLNAQLPRPSQSSQTSRSSLDQDLFFSVNKQVMKSKPSSLATSGKIHGEILVTWRSLIKITFGSILLIMLLSLGIERWNDRKNEIKSLNNLETNILKD